MAQSLSPLAVPADVEEALGRDLTSSEQARVDAALAHASSLFRLEAKCDFAHATLTRRLKVNGGEVRLPGGPVLDVVSVTDAAGAGVPFTRFGRVLQVDQPSDNFLTVTYVTDTDIPSIVVTTVASMVARSFSVDPRAQAGMTQYQNATGPFTEGGTFASWAVGGQILLSPADSAVAAKFRGTRLPSTVVLK